MQSIGVRGAVILLEHKGDRICLRGLEFFAYHGVLPEENKLGQRFIIDIDLLTSLQKAGISDEVEHTVNYAEVYNTVKNIVTGETHKLIERLAERIAKQILEDFPLCQGIWLKVHKPGAPIPGIFADVAVEIYRERSR